MGRRFFGIDEEFMERNETSAASTKDKPAGPETVNGKINNTSCVNVREGPSLKAKVLGVLNWGDPVGILARENGFCKVSTPNGFIGYIVDKYVKEV